MKKLSKQQLLFSVISIILTTTFFYLLNNFVETQQWKSVLILAVFFATLMFFNGLLNGYFESERLQRIDISLRYHFMTFVLVNTVYLIYILLPNNIFLFDINIFGIVFWGVGLLTHFLISKKSIKGYSSSDLFE